MRFQLTRSSHLIVAHDVITTGSDRQQLAAMSEKAKVAMGVDRLEMLADRGYFSGEEIVACEAMGVTPYVPKPLTSGAKADGRFGKQDFVYVADQDVYRCPAGALLPRHMTTVENGLTRNRVTLWSPTSPLLDRGAVMSAFASRWTRSERSPGP